MYTGQKALAVWVDMLSTVGVLAPRKLWSVCLGAMSGSELGVSVYCGCRFSGMLPTVRVAPRGDVSRCRPTLSGRHACR